MQYIQLTQNKKAIVDKEDYEELSKYKWYYKTYAVRNGWVNGKRTTIRMHRQIMIAPIDKEVDHINRDKLDNRKTNLRVCTRSENQWNRGKQKGTSMYKGVYWNKQNKKWHVQLEKNGKYVWLGYYDNEEGAHKAYCVGAKKHFGKYSRVA